jgi:hypothetical protein
MTRFRAFIVAATIAGPIALSLASLVLDRVLWPFSQYPMYSGLADSTAAVTRAVGVDRDGRELPLPPQIEPTGIHLHSAVDHVRSSPDATVRLRRIAIAMLTQYEHLRATGEIAGPPFTAVRIYRDSIRIATHPHVRSTVLITDGLLP